ncbi:MAG: MFS transporter [Planctomycetia bacterium]|nr:MFS transporter [Planctomycetia bacterium]
MTIESPTGEARRAPPQHDPYAALRARDYRLFLAGNFLSVVGYKMQVVAVGYEIYQRTGWPLALGLVGLVQIVPVLALALLAGHVADRFDRRNIILATMAVTALAAAGLAVVSLGSAPLWTLYALILVVAVARGFSQPARASLLPQLVDRAAFPNAVTWSTGAFQLAFVLGPALAGLLIAAFAHGPAIVYACHAAAALAFFALLAMVRRRPVTQSTEGLTLESLVAGARFVGRQKVMLAAITLDLFAVLLGGATALLPVYAKDILAVGPRGLGWMEAAPAAGAVVMALVIAHRPPMKKAGRAMLWSVAGFGVATIIFGLSRSFPLSLLMLLLTGALDNISVVIRHTLVQVLTPDEMRGRVSAINGMFIGASNELGAFESGLVASLFTSMAHDVLAYPSEAAVTFGTTFSVVSGGLGTLAVVGLLWLLAPDLLGYGRLAGHEPPVTDQ